MKGNSKELSSLDLHIRNIVISQLSKATTFDDLYEILTTIRLSYQSDERALAIYDNLLSETLGKMQATCTN